jgi:hypothetical protein
LVRVATLEGAAAGRLARPTADRHQRASTGPGCSAAFRPALLRADGHRLDARIGGVLSDRALDQLRRAIAKLRAAVAAG